MAERRELRDRGVYRLPGGEMVVAVKLDDERYFLYREDAGEESKPFAEVNPDGNVIPLLLTGAGWRAEDLEDMLRDQNPAAAPPSP